ncbi:glycine--tRNA ligase subunit beta [Sediminicurvatus halobius]|uniref:Glycine--tRNA ligase beta subunit n=1 Tax=Sediminicurvatus halobius TaxID=2182432 RepID=A0A2U2N2U4_9GAMM|nr:glycine--tRNA ligase subunit beta [Spiribacter halobius]PWG63393.1 glycine--tRNA ligase subunit beta [Spiribacter halobius]UEX78063.1 glycine--tRNA ligase subunit beta [Spiribacter halobius]
MSAGQAALLFELGTEELPPGALTTLRDALQAEVTAGLARAEVGHGAVRAFAAPRRLALQLDAVALRQPDRPFERRGPALNVAFDEAGQPTRAAEGFARSCGVAVPALERLETEQGAWLVHRGVEPGQPTAALLPGIIEQALARLPIPKRMRWGDRDAEFVRPVHWLVLLLGDEVVPAEVLGVNSGRRSRGHRFHHPQPLEIPRPEAYEATLRDPGHVVADFDTRRALIAEGVRAEGERIGGHAVMEETLLDEVTALVEWPVVLSGSFDEDFLRVPPEALISSMQGHQRYFPVRDAEGRLLPRFIAVANIDSRDPQQIVRGNERVIRPRLADAAFFWDQDRRRPLADRLEGLREVVFQKRLGSLYDKSARVAELAAAFASDFGADPEQARRAGLLARADLLTEMVGEFPELQGVMGRYYAEHDGEPDPVARALDEIYQPRFSGDAIAPSRLGQLLAVAERADTLAGIFAIGKAPSGAKDPFALRRAALGLLRTLIEGGHEIDLGALFATAAERQPAGVDAGAQVTPLVTFCLERLRAFYHEQGYPVELFEAVRSVLAPPQVVPLDVERRLRACREFASLPESGSLAAANKRIRNILRRAEGEIPDGAVDPAALREPPERALHEAIEERAGSVEAAIAGGDYSAALRRLAELRDPVDAFFDGVMVMAEDPAVRRNRLALLQRLERLFLAIADVSRLPEHA